MPAAIQAAKQSRDEQLGAALRRIAQRFPKFNEEHFAWYVDTMLADAARLEDGPPIEWVSRSRVEVEPPGPPHIDGMIERFLEMVTGAATGVTSPISDQVRDAKEALAEAGLPDTLTPAQAIAQLAARLPVELPDPVQVLASWGWTKSVKPNTYVPKPLSVWVHAGNDSAVLVHRGRVDTSGCEAALETEELLAFVDLADSHEAAAEPVTTETPVRMLVWMYAGHRQPTCLDLDDGGLLADVRHSPIQLLIDSGEFVGSAEDPRPAHARPGLWLWNGIATSVSRGESPDEISLRGGWRRLTSTEAMTASDGANLSDLPRTIGDERATIS